MFRRIPCAICLAMACLGLGVFASVVHAASPAWAPIAASGPTNLPPVQSEIQRLEVQAEGGTFALTAHKVAGTADFSSLGANATFITLSNKTGSFAIGQTLVGQHIAPGTTIANSFGDLLVISQPTTNTSTVTGGTVYSSSVSSTTSGLPFDVQASVVQQALNELATVGGEGASVEVAGGPGATSPFFVTFGGNAANTDLPSIGLPVLEINDAGLTGLGSPRVFATTALEGGAGTAEIGIYPQNVGGLQSSGTTQLRFELPPGVVTSSAPTGPNGDAAQWNCPLGSGEDAMTCTSTLTVGPGVTLPPLNVPVETQPGATSGSVEVEVWGGGSLSTEAMPATYQMPLVVSSIPAPAGLQAWTAGAYTDQGVIDTKAAAHPYSASTGILVNTVRSPRGLVVPAAEFRDIVADIPPGFLGNPIATEQCLESLEHLDCPHESMMALSQVPIAVSEISKPVFEWGELAAVNNIEAPLGYPAKFRFLTGLNQVLINVVGSLRSDSDYGISAGSYNSPQIKPVIGAFFTIWGTPADEGHDELRCKDFNNAGVPSDCGPGGEDVAFLTNPVDCAEEAARTPKAVLNVNTWQDPTLLFAGEVALQPVTGCGDSELVAKAEELVESFSFGPGDNVGSDSPASFRTEMIVPTDGLLDPDERMTPTIRESVVELPKGVVLNASAADGLEACSLEQIGYKGNDFPRPNEIRFTKDPNNCPDASKIGSGEVKSELLEDPLGAEIFLAAQNEGNPFGSLFAIYLVIENPDRGLFIKLPGEVQVDEQTGQQKIVFRDLPPLPFSSLKLNLKGGPRSPLATPTTCGTYATTVTNTPWSAPESGPPDVSAGSFAVNSGPNGLPCAPTEADRPFDIGLRAGSTTPLAGAHTPFQISVTRPDGHQEIDRLEVSPPPGFVASLKGIPYCSDPQVAAAAGKSGKAEQADPSCPPASQVGTTNAAAGSGPSPYYTPGKLYLAGPYKGAPLSVVAITPAVAGPFDLGTVVIRSALRIDPVTARITAVTDSLPRILEGVPLRIRDVRIDLDRANWAQNPTSCEAMAVDVTAFGSNGAVSKPSNRFQVGGCENLGFKPRILLSLKGGTKRGDNPALKAVVRPRPGDSNIASAAVTLPRSAFLDQAHIKTICTRVQFAADACPKAAIYGRASAVTPLLDDPITGPVYLRSSDNELPDLVADLRGPAHQPIKIEAAFRTDSIKGGIRSTLDFAPDAPVTEFTLQMQGGRKGLVINSQNLCAKTRRAKAKLRAHNGRRLTARPKVVALNCSKKKRKRKHGRR